MIISLKNIAQKINEKSKGYKIGKLQDIRKELKGLSRKSTKNIFVNTSNTITENWAYHYGGLTEI